MPHQPLPPIIEKMHDLFGEQNLMDRKLLDEEALAIARIVGKPPQEVRSIMDGVKRDYGRQIRDHLGEVQRASTNLQAISHGKRFVNPAEAKTIVDAAELRDKAELRLNELHQEIFQRFGMQVPQHLSISNFRRTILERREGLGKMMPNVLKPQQPQPKGRRRDFKPPRRNK